MLSSRNWSTSEKGKLRGKQRNRGRENILWASVVGCLHIIAAKVQMNPCTHSFNEFFPLFSPFCPHEFDSLFSPFHFLLVAFYSLSRVCLHFCHTQGERHTIHSFLLPVYSWGKGDSRENKNKTQSERESKRSEWSEWVKNESNNKPGYNNF